jgi:hypothetical protein
VTRAWQVDGTVTASMTARSFPAEVIGGESQRQMGDAQTSTCHRAMHEGLPGTKPSPACYRDARVAGRSGCAVGILPATRVDRTETGPVAPSCPIDRHTPSGTPAHAAPRTRRLRRDPRGREARGTGSRPPGSYQVLTASRTSAVPPR